MRGIADKGLLLLSLAISHSLAFGMENLLARIPAERSLAWGRPVIRVVSIPRPSLPKPEPPPAPAPPPPAKTKPVPVAQKKVPAARQMPSAAPPQEVPPQPAPRPPLKPALTAVQTVPAANPALVPIKLGLAPARGVIAAPRIQVSRPQAALPVGLGAAETPAGSGRPAAQAVGIEVSAFDPCRGAGGVKCSVSGLGDRTLREDPRLPRTEIPAGLAGITCSVSFRVDRFGNVSDAVAESCPVAGAGRASAGAVTSWKFAVSPGAKAQSGKIVFEFTAERRDYE